MRMQKIQNKVFRIIEKHDPKDIAGKVFDLGIIMLIILNITAVILSSFKGLPESLLFVLDVFEIISVIIFSLEYVLRVWTSPLLHAHSRHPRFRQRGSV